MPKYDKYFITEPKPGDDIHLDTDLVKFPIYVDSEVIEGAHYFMAASHLGTTGRGAPDIEHTHDFDEYLVFLGTDHKEPSNLGGEIEFWLEDEQYIINKTALIFVLRGMKHLPLYFRKIGSPVLFFTVGNGTSYTRLTGKE